MEGRGRSPMLGGPSGWASYQPLEGMGRGRPGPPPSFSRRASSPWLLPLLLPFPTLRSEAALAAAPCSIPPSLSSAGAGPCCPQQMAEQ